MSILKNQISKVNPDLGQENFKTMNWDSIEERHNTDHDSQNTESNQQFRYQDTFKTEYDDDHLGVGR